MTDYHDDPIQISDGGSISWRMVEEVTLNSPPTKGTAQMLALISENERLREKVSLLESASIAFHGRREFIWWQGVNAQWKHRPIGNRLPETDNPYRGNP